MKNNDGKTNPFMNPESSHIYRNNIKTKHTTPSGSNNTCKCNSINIKLLWSFYLS